MRERTEKGKIKQKSLKKFASKKRVLDLTRLLDFKFSNETLKTNKTIARPPAGPSMMMVAREKVGIT